MDVIGQVTAVAGVLFLLVGMSWWLRRRGIAAVFGPPKASGRKLECLEQLPLGPHHTLHLVRLGDTALLVASSPGGCALVHSLPSCEIAGPRESLR